MERCNRCSRWAEIKKGICRSCVREIKGFAELAAKAAIPDPRAQPHRCTSVRCVDCDPADERPRFLVRLMTGEERELRTRGQGCALEGGATERVVGDPVEPWDSDRSSTL